MVRAKSSGMPDSMRTAYILTVALALTASAAAQSGDSVTVNPLGTQVLIDPGTGQERVVPPLMQPWQAEPVRLHPPRRHHARSVQTDVQDAGVPATTAPASAIHPRRTSHVASAGTPPSAPPSSSQQAAPSLDDMNDLLTRSQHAAPLPPPQQTASAPVPRHATIEPPPKPAVSKPPARTASITRPNPQSSAGTRRDTIVFTAGATDPSTAAVSAVRTLAGSLNTALSDSGSRVQLLAYGGAKGEKSSDTRRLSLKRALVIRQLLIDDGVPSERIDVFALGGVEDDGPLDRVDVYVKS